jgi:putative transcriptional regulator
LKDFAEALQSGATISDHFTCRKVVVNLQPTPYGPKLVKKTRRLLGASQAVFARFLGVSIQTVRAWEQGENTPSDMARRFMDEIRHNPTYWLERLTQTAVAKTTAVNDGPRGTVPKSRSKAGRR